MKKKVSILLATVMLGGMLSACGGGTDGVLSGNSGDKTKVTFWSHYSVGTDYQKELINKFNESNNEIEIEFNMVSDQYSDMLYMSMTSNDAPDVFTITGPSMTKKMSQADWIAPLNEYVTDEFKAKFLDGVWIPNSNVIDGNIMMVPDQSATFRMLYNKELFKQAGLENPPKTFEEMREAAKKIEALGSDIDGFGLALSDTYMLDCAVFNGMGPYSLGIYHGYDYAKGEFDYSQYKPVIELFRNMRKDGSLMDGELLLGVDTVRAKFAEGKVGMIPSVSWETSMFDALNPQFEIGITSYPTLDGTAKGKSPNAISSGFAMSKSCKNPDAAWKAIEFLSSEEFTGKLNEKNATISVFRENKTDGEPANELQPAFMPNETDGVWPALVPNLKMKGDFKGPVFITLITEETADIDATLTDLTERSNQAFKEAVENGEFKAEDFFIKDFDPANLK